MSDVGKDKDIKMEYVKQIKDIKELQETTRAISCQAKGVHVTARKRAGNPVELIHRMQWETWTRPFCCGLFHDWETAIAWCVESLLQDGTTAC